MNSKFFKKSLNGDLNGGGMLFLPVKKYLSGMSKPILRRIPIIYFVE